MSGKPLKWYPFDPTKGSRQKRPPERKLVLVRTQQGDFSYNHDKSLMIFTPEEGSPPGLAVGYLKNSAGDKQSPFFVIPGIGGDVTAWCDCLPPELTFEDFKGKESKK